MAARKRRPADTKRKLAADLFKTEEMMQGNTLIDTEFEPTPVQIGEPFHCWECGSPDQGGMFLIIDHSPLEAYADHIYYMRLVCGHNNRCVRLGDAIAPLQPLNRSIEGNLHSVRAGLANLAQAVPPDRQNQEPVSKIVYLLVAGRISPQTAINQLHSLILTAEPLQSVQLPAIAETLR
jgi:hypothetical protein